MDLHEFVITLWNRDDLEEFYNDMETPGGNLYIPDRQVDLTMRREISRNTHYMLTFDEAREVAEDPRVRGVAPLSLVEEATKPAGYKITSGQFDKQWSGDVGDDNWGLLRHSEELNRSNWGDGISDTKTITTDLTVTASGKNVDIVIFDGHIDPSHPEFAVNSDGTGGSRVVQENWFTHGGSGTYTYTPYVDSGNSNRTTDNEHGNHVASTAAGNTQGWARDANIYNINPYSTNVNGNLSSTMWDYVRTWHNQKSVNSETGRRNPTITNHSYGSSLTMGEDNYSQIKSINYRGTNFNPGRDLTLAEIQARGCYASNTVGVEIPYYFTGRISDIEDAIDDGIIVVVAAGNDSWKTVNSSDQDYNNTYSFEYFGFSQTTQLHRGTGSGAGIPETINVGALSNNEAEDKAYFSNCGSQVDVFAAGEAIQGALLTAPSFGGADPRNGSYYLGKYQGTSMASPQVCGILACLAESWPNMTQAQAHQWIVDNATDDEMYDTEADDAQDRQSLQGGPNKIARWKNQRAVSGEAYPRKTISYRPTSGAVYPRTRIRKRG